MKKNLRLLLLIALMIPLGVRSQSATSATALPFSTGFENVGDDTAWHFNNVGNGWFIGSATNNGGSRALYISNTNGTTHAYDPTVESMSYAYRPVYFESTGQYILSFDWKNNGMASYWGLTTCFNMLYPYLIPGTVDMTVSPLTPDDYLWTPCVDSYLGNASTWQHSTITLNITTPGVYYLAFLYYCYGAGGANPPAAIDNVSLTPLGCMQPTGLAVDSLSSSEIGIHWTPGGPEDIWLVRADDDEWLEIYDTFYLFTDLASGMLHTLEVAAICPSGDTSLAAAITQRTSCGIVSHYPWREDFTGFSSTATLPCWTHLGAGAYRFSSGEMELRPMGSTDVNIVTTPTFADLSQLELTFTTHPEGDYSGSLSVGYVTGAETAYVFTPVATYAITEWVDPDMPLEKTVSFLNAPDSARIAFRHNPNSSNWYWYIDDIDVHLMPMCARPNNLTLAYADENSIELSWSDDNGNATSYTIYYRQSDSLGWDDITVSDTSVTISGLEPGTSYDVRLLATCGDGTVSTELTGTFMTACGIVDTFPYEEGFDNISSLCWQIFSMNSASSDNWAYTTSASDTRNFSTGAYASGYNDVESCNEWLVSPAIELPEGVSNFTLSWYSHGRAWQSYRPRVEVKVSTSQTITQENNNTVSLDTTVFSTTLYAETLDETDFVKHSVNLGQFAGQTVHLAFVRRGYNDYFVVLEDISVYPSQEPDVTIAGPASPVVGLAATYRAVLNEGSHDSLSYTWSSAAATAGSATMTLVDSATVSLLYTSTSPDLLTVVATNAFGSDTATMAVNPMTTTYTALPYSTGFETSDDVAWTLANDTANAWYIDSAVYNTGNRALYISNDNGLQNNYDNNTSSYSYAYKSFNFASDGQYSIDFDWRCYGEGSYDNLNVYLLPLGTAITAGTDAGSSWNSLTGQLTAANTWQHLSSIFYLDVPGVYHLVFAWKNDNVMGSNPAAAVDNLSLTAITCVAPESVSFDTIGADMARFHWSGTATAWEVTVGDMAPIIINDTFYTTSTLQPATSYSVHVRAICGAGDSSLYTSTAFTTECTPFGIPFSHDFPGTSLSACWTNSFFTPYPSTSWSDGAGTNHRIYSAAAYNATPADDWLISPLINIPVSDTVSLELVYFVYGYPNTNYTTSSANYEVLVSPTGGVAPNSFSDTLFSEAGLDTTTFMRRHLPMSQYAGQSIRIAFRNTSTFNGRIYLNEVSLRRTREPLFSVQGPNLVWVNDTNIFSAIYQEGNLSGMTYSWTSTMAAAGNAALYGTNSDTLSINYFIMGIDTLTFVAHNSFGSDTIITHVSVMDLNPVSSFPYNTGFESSNTDNLSWIPLNGSNAWSLGSATSHSCSQSYYISNDFGASNTYTLNNTSRSYLYRAFDFSATGNYVVRFDWKALGESNFDYLRAWLVPDTAFHVQANAYPIPGISANSALATANIPGWIAVGGKLNLSSNWTTESDTVDITAPGRYNLVFLWVNDGSLGSNPPVAIDNIFVNYGTASLCEPPVIDSILVSETSISFSFSSMADNYEVAIVQGPWTDSPLNTEHLTLNTHTFSTLAPNTLYTVGVRALCDDDMYSDWTTQTVTTDAHPCYAPSNVTASELTFTTATIAWTPGDESQTHFQIRYSTAGDTILVNNVTENPYTLSGLYNNTLYSVAVRAVCGDNYSDWSASGTFRTTECEPVSGITVSDITSSGATVSWNDNGSNAYELAYGEQGTSQENFTRQRGTATTYTITGLEASTAYTVYVRSICDEDAYSNWSDSYDFTTHEVGISDIDNSNISLYPNPASSTVTLTGIEGEATVTIIDMNGREIQAIKHSENQAIIIDVSGFAQGAYFVRITGEHFNAIRKLIIR